MMNLLSTLSATCKTARALVRHTAEIEMLKRFERRPDDQLSQAGFTWALVLYFEKYWRGMGRDYALSCAKDCLEVPYGTEGYDWSASAAKELVEEYVSQHGEVR